MLTMAAVCSVAGMRVMPAVVGVANLAGGSGVAPGVTMRSCVTAMPTVATVTTMTTVRQAAQRHHRQSGAPGRQGDEVEVHD